MHTTAQLLTLIRDAIATNVDLSAWCVSKYGKTPTIYTGVDMGSPPPNSDFPIIVIEDIPELRGNAANTISWVAAIGCGIIDPTLTEASVTIPGEDPEDDPVVISTTKTFAGIADVETMREKVETILLSARFAKLSFNTESVPLIIYPEFDSFTFVTIEQINPRRRL